LSFQNYAKIPLQGLESWVLNPHGPQNMNYIYLIFFTTLSILFLDIGLTLFRLRLSGIIKGYKLLSQGVGYISKQGSSFKGDLSKKVLILGDSTAVGAGANPEETIGGRLSKKFNVDVINLGVNGAQTKDVVSQIKTVSEQKFYLTIIHIGNLETMLKHPCKV
jgi:hypothetical protein